MTSPGLNNLGSSHLEVKPPEQSLPATTSPDTREISERHAQVARRTARSKAIASIQDPTVRAGLVCLLTFLIFSIIADHFLTMQAAYSYLTIAAESGP